MIVIDLPEALSRSSHQGCQTLYRIKDALDCLLLLEDGLLEVFELLTILILHLSKSLLKQFYPFY